MAQPCSDVMKASSSSHFKMKMSLIEIALKKLALKKLCTILTKQIQLHVLLNREKKVAGLPMLYKMTQIALGRC